MKAEWNYERNMTDFNAAILAEINIRINNYSGIAYKMASRFNTSAFDYDTKRLLSKIGSPSLDSDEMTRLINVSNEMKRIYGRHEVIILFRKV